MGYVQTSLVKDQSFLRNLFIVLATSAVFGLVASISIPLPFTPVPISFTAQLILLFSVLLGKRGAYATFAYLAQGAIGLPVFANGASGIGCFLGPTGGYLIGFAVASYVVAVFSERMREKSASKTFGLMLVGNVLFYVFGLPHLALVVGAEKALMFGLFPFIATDILKLILAQKALKALKFFE
ncbi:MAG: biotin transporter BioY [Verrucomicrobia bacterium]|nr:biotin transporter BioY [Verrucomicrobiota bacterium]